MKKRFSIETYVEIGAVLAGIGAAVVIGCFIWGGLKLLGVI